MVPQVLLLLEDASIGGVATIAATLRDGLDADGWPVNTLAVRGTSWRLLLAAARRSDVILAAHNFLPAYVAWALGRAAGKPVVVWFHGPLQEVLQQAEASTAKRRWLAWLYRRQPRRVFVSQASRRSFESFMQGAGAPGEATAVIPNAVCGQPRAQAPASTGRTELAYVGRLSAEKDPFLLLDALRLLPPHYRLTMIGDGPLRDGIARAGADLMAADRLVLAGPRAQGPALYQPWRLTVLASVYEGCPMSMLESLAFGVPCAAVPIPAVAELLADTAPTMLAPRRSASGLAQAIEAVAHAPHGQLAAEMARVLERHRPADFVQRWQQVLLKAVARPC